VLELGHYGDTFVIEPPDNIRPTPAASTATTTSP
jgi:hypothetical protein